MYIYISQPFVHFQMYAEALHENERLKSRLQDSRKELDKIRSQLERVTQVEQMKFSKMELSAGAHYNNSIIVSSRGTTGYQRDLRSSTQREGYVSLYYSAISICVLAIFPLQLQSTADCWIYVYFLLLITGKASSWEKSVKHGGGVKG